MVGWILKGLKIEKVSKQALLRIPEGPSKAQSFRNLDAFNKKCEHTTNASLLTKTLALCLFILQSIPYELSPHHDDVKVGSLFAERQFM